jgi:phenylalanyl-tRNA synthetase beta subunit
MGINAGTTARFGGFFGGAPGPAVAAPAALPASVPTAAQTAQAAQAAQTAQTLQMGGAAIQVIGAISSSISQRLALKGAAAIAEINAGVAERAAQQEMSRGQDLVAQVTERAGQVKGAQRAAMAANGIDLGEGSAAEVLTTTDMVKEHDMQTIQSNAVRAAWGHRVNATSLTGQAAASRAGADSISPLVAGTSSLLSSAGQIAGSWYSMNKNGVAPKGT